MRLTLEQDYAIRIVYELCRAKKRLDVNELSTLTGVTPLFTQKIMRKLNKNSLVESKKGVQGGYIISRPPENISLYDVFSAIDGDICINACLSDKYTCNRPEVLKNSVCYIQNIFKIINDDFINSLKKETFDKLINNF